MIGLPLCENRTLRSSPDGLPGRGRDRVFVWGSREAGRGKASGEDRWEGQERSGRLQTSGREVHRNLRLDAGTGAGATQSQGAPPPPYGGDGTHVQHTYTITQDAPTKKEGACAMRSLVDDERTLEQAIGLALRSRVREYLGTPFELAFACLNDDTLRGDLHACQQSWSDPDIEELQLGNKQLKMIIVCPLQFGFVRQRDQNILIHRELHVSGKIAARVTFGLYRNQGLHFPPKHYVL